MSKLKEVLEKLEGLQKDLLDELKDIFGDDHPVVDNAATNLGHTINTARANMGEVDGEVVAVDATQATIAPKSSSAHLEGGVASGSTADHTIAQGDATDVDETLREVPAQGSDINTSPATGEQVAAAMTGSTGNAVSTQPAPEEDEASAGTAGTAASQSASAPIVDSTTGVESTPVVDENIGSGSTGGSPGASVEAGTTPAASTASEPASTEAASTATTTTEGGSSVETDQVIPNDKNGQPAPHGVDAEGNALPAPTSEGSSEQSSTEHSGS